MQSNHLNALFGDIHPEWMKLFKKNVDLRTTLGDSIKKIKHTEPDVICPPYEKILECFRHFAPLDTKVVIMGQDPYYTPNDATGLCFSVGTKKPSPSLRNIAAAIERNCQQKLKSNDLVDWAKQGILMLNARLTTVLGKAKEEGHEVWEAFTDKVVEWIDQNVEGVVFVLWGNNARAKGNFVKKAKIMGYTHPSPMADAALKSERKFINCPHFVEINKHLESLNKEVIIWGDVIECNIGDTEGVNGESSTNDSNSSTDNSSTSKRSANNNTSLIDMPNELRTCDTAHIVFVDGACIGNGKKTARASYAYHITRGPLAPHGDAQEIGSYNNVIATNNRGELLAFIKSLEYIHKNLDLINDVKQIIYVTDSLYCMNIVNSWLNKWITEGTLQERKNFDLLQELDVVIKKLKENNMIINVVHQNSHLDAPSNRDSDEYFKWEGNDKVDKMATKCLPSN